MEEELGLLDLAVLVVRRRRAIMVAVFAFTTIGVVVALASPPEYRATMTVVSELGGDAAVGGGLGATLRSFGFSLQGGRGTGTLSPQAIPEIASSRQVRLAVARDTMYFPVLGSSSTLVDYLARDQGFGVKTVLGFIRSWTIGLPSRILGLFRAPSSVTSGGTTGFLTEEEESAVLFLSTAISTSEDFDSGLITITARSPDPQVAAQLAQSVAKHLRSLVQRVYTNKSRQDLEFVEAQFSSARDELLAADAALAAFQDRNLGVRSSRLQIEEQRLQREVSFKSQLYTELQAQLTQAQIELQKSEPVITTIESPTPPRQPVGPNRKLTVVLSMILGGLVALGWILVSAALDSGLRDPKTSVKLAELRSVVPRLRRGSS